MIRRNWAILLTLLALVIIGVNGALAGGKITICHTPPGNINNPRTITIAEEAWNAGHSPHNSHSLDYVGACPDPTKVPTSVPPTSPPPVPTATQPGPEPTPTNQPPRNPTATPVWEGEVCNAPEATTCDTCGTLGGIAYDLGRVANALEWGNWLQEQNTYELGRSANALEYSNWLQEQAGPDAYELGRTANALEYSNWLQEDEGISWREVLLGAMAGGLVVFAATFVTYLRREW